MKFLDIKTDYAFKKVFGSDASKRVLISFLNSIIDFPEGKAISDLTIVDPYQIPMIKGMKDTFVDVKATLSDGTKVIVEMQVLNVEGFEQRILYNAAKAYSSQLEKGDKYHLLEPVIALTITDFTMFDSVDLKDKVISYFKLMEKEKFITYTNDVELIFLELPKFTKSEKELETITDKWIYFIKNAGSMEYIPDTLKISEEISKAFETANTASMSREELELQRKRHDFIWLQKGSIEKAKKDGQLEGHAEGYSEGVEKGIEKGIAKGVRQERRIQEERRKLDKIHIVYKMIEKKIDIEIISELTGLSIQEIKKLKSGDFNSF